MGVLGIDTFSRTFSFLGSFRPCAGPQGVNYAPWPQCHLFGPLFGPYFFTICADKNGGAWDRYLQYCLLISWQFPALCGPAGCALCSMASVSPVWTAFWAAFFHNLCGQEWGCLG